MWRIELVDQLGKVNLSFYFILFYFIFFFCLVVGESSDLGAECGMLGVSTVS